MSRKDKARRFRENATFTCLLQPTTEEVFRKDHPIKGLWGEKMFGNDHPIILELGCGKGEYTIALAERHPENNYIGVDIKGARLWKGAKYATENHLPNVAFLRTRIEFIESLFGPDEVSEIWITFADPQPLKPKKRLTSQFFLDQYAKFLKSGNPGHTADTADTATPAGSATRTGIIHLKTDSLLLHQSTLEVIAENHHTLIEANADIYGSGRASDDELLQIRTFYESQFLAQGLPITYCEFIL